MNPKARVTAGCRAKPPGGNSVEWKRADLTYNARGQFSTITRKNATATVVETTYGYDSNGRLTSLDHDDGASNELASCTWTWDFSNSITAATADDGTSSYTYDDTSQLTGATHSYQTDESYTYDANGNRQMTGYSTGTNNQLLSDGTYNYEYDDEGNRTKKTEISTGDYVEYSWDHRNRLTDVTFKTSTHSVTKKVSYTYDVWNRRLEKKVDTDGDSDIDRTETFLYDSQVKGFGNLTDVLLVYKDADGEGSGPSTLDSRLLHGPAVDQVFADEQASGDLYWLLADHQGTVRDIAEYDSMMMQTDIASHRTFDSFGNITSETDTTVDTVYGYTSRETDEDVDLTYYRARWFDAGVGRFVSEDPIGFWAADTNLTRYVSHSPLILVDPSGLDAAENHLYLTAEPDVPSNTLAIFDGQHPGSGDPKGFDLDGSVLKNAAGSLATVIVDGSGTAEKLAKDVRGLVKARGRRFDKVFVVDHGAGGGQKLVKKLLSPAQVSVINNAIAKGGNVELMGCCAGRAPGGIAKTSTGMVFRNAPNVGSVTSHTGNVRYPHIRIGSVIIMLGKPTNVAPGKTVTVSRKEYEEQVAAETEQSE